MDKAYEAREQLRNNLRDILAYYQEKRISVDYCINQIERDYKNAGFRQMVYKNCHTCGAVKLRTQLRDNGDFYNTYHCDLFGWMWWPETKTKEMDYISCIYWTYPLIQPTTPYPWEIFKGEKYEGHEQKT